MRVEFATIGNGTNIQVSLLEMLGDTEVVTDRFYSAQHQFRLEMEMDEALAAWDSYCFPVLEDLMLSPIIGGSFSHLHPYWEERRKRREARRGKSRELRTLVPEYRHRNRQQRRAKEQNTNGNVTSRGEDDSDKR